MDELVVEKMTTLPEIIEWIHSNKLSKEKTKLLENLFNIFPINTDYYLQFEKIKLTKKMRNYIINQLQYNFLKKILFKNL